MDKTNKQIQKTINLAKSWGLDLSKVEESIFLNHLKGIAIVAIQENISQSQKLIDAIN